MSKEDEEGGEAELRKEKGETEKDEVSDWEMTPEERGSNLSISCCISVSILRRPSIEGNGRQTR